MKVSITLLALLVVFANAGKGSGSNSSGSSSSGSSSSGSSSSGSSSGGSSSHEHNFSELADIFDDPNFVDVAGSVHEILESLTDNENEDGVLDTDNDSCFGDNNDLLERLSEAQDECESEVEADLESSEETGGLNGLFNLFAGSNSGSGSGSSSSRSSESGSRSGSKSGKSSSSSSSSSESGSRSGSKSSKSGSSSSGSGSSSSSSSSDSGSDSGSSEDARDILFRVMVKKCMLNRIGWINDDNEIQFDQISEDLGTTDLAEDLSEVVEDCQEEAEEIDEDTISSLENTSFFLGTDQDDKVLAAVRLGSFFSCVRRDFDAACNDDEE